MAWQVLAKDTEIVAIHAALLPTNAEGDVLYFGDWVNINTQDAGPTLCRIYHMTTATVEGFAPADVPSTNAFCGSHAFLARGWLLVGGGTVRKPVSEEPGEMEDPGETGAAEAAEETAEPIPAGANPHDEMGHWDGERACWIYRPDLKRWFRAADFNTQPGSTSKGGGRWYPMLVALGDGQVFAAGGHPNASDDYVTPQGGGGQRHNNNTPERYLPAADTWTLITTAITALNSLATDEFPRFRLLPDGNLFTTTPGSGAKRIFDPIAGTWTGPDVDTGALPGEYVNNPGRASYTSVLLPLLPPSYAPRVLATNSPHPTSFLVDIDAAPVWQAAPNRQGSNSGLVRWNACAVLLPTAQVLVSGGTRPNLDPTRTATQPTELGAFEPELYTPAVDWTTGAFTGPGSWETLADPASVIRGYHSVALLLPDGRVWTAGTTQGWSNLATAELRVEIFSPWYVGQSRPHILSVGTPRRRGAIHAEGFEYGETFTVRVNAVIQRVALMRCGSVTHSYDSDQRYIGLDFSQQGGVLSVTAPPSGAIAPPGYYMLWVIDAAGVPCERASFVHLPKFLLLPKKNPIRVRPNTPKHPSVGPKKPSGPKKPMGPKKGLRPKKRVGPRKAAVPKKRIAPKKRVGKSTHR